jgi:hypothetical protein
MDQIMKVLTTTHVGKFAPRTRVMAAQWMLVYFTIKTLSSASVEDFAKRMKEQEQVMPTCWKMLNFEPSDLEEEKALDLLRLDVATRLKDPKRLVPSFERIMRRRQALTEEEVVVAFTCAPVLGRWSAMRSLGDRLMTMGHKLEDFHTASMHRPDIPDYEVLYKLAKDEAKSGDARLEDLHWGSLTIESVEIRLRAVECADRAKAERLAREFDPTNSKEWRVVPLEQGSRLLRVGAMAQMIALSTVPIPMVGPASPTRMRLLGYAVMDAAGSVKVRQTESYTLESSSKEPNLWVGEYQLLQDQVKPKVDSARARVVWEMRMRLSPDDPNAPIETAFPDPAARPVSLPEAAGAAPGPADLD